MPPVGGERETLDDMFLGARGNAECEPFAMIGEELRIDDERVAFPMTDRVTVERPLAIFGMRPPI
jgi:hypothetical protein